MDIDEWNRRELIEARGTMRMFARATLAALLGWLVVIGGALALLLF